MNEIAQKVNRYQELVRQEKEIKNEIAQLKGYFETTASEELKNTKFKTISYWGDNNAKVTISMNETIKIVSNETLKKIFGNLYPDLITEKQSYDLSSQAKKLLTPIFQGDYIETNLDEVLNAISDDLSIQDVLKKKLKGDYKKDKDLIQKVAGIDEIRASELAYFAKEVIAYNKFKSILEACENTDIKEAIDNIKIAVIVEEGIKVTFEEE